MRTSFASNEPAHHGTVNKSKRFRRHSAPGSVSNFKYEYENDIEFASPPPPPFCVRDPSDDLKVSFKSIKHLFPKCRVKVPPLKWMGKKYNPKDIYLVPLPMDITEKVPEETEGNADVIRCNSQVHSSFEDNFVEVEWDNNDGKNEQYYNDHIANKPNVKVREILVLKPNWLGKDCKIVTFRDCHINLINEDLFSNTKKPKEEKCHVTLEPSGPSSVNADATESADKSTEDNRSLSSSSSNSSSSDDDTDTTIEANTKKKRKVPVLKARNVRNNGSVRNQHPCELCDKAFPKISLLFKHLVRHTGEKPHQCGTCGMRFNCPSNLRRHKRVHARRRPYKCLICGKAFKRNDILREHIQIHINEKPHKCTVCNENFSQKYQLKIHMGLVHTGENPYQCKFCRRPFTRSSNLCRHVKMGRCSGSKRNISSTN